MTPHELAEKCAETIGKNLKHVQLVIPAPSRARICLRVLGGTKGVKRLMGEVCCENASGHTVVWVDAITLLAWLAAYAGVRVEVGGGR